MSDDFIERAEALIQPMQCYTETWLVEAEQVLPQLVDEIKHLRTDNKFLHKFVDDPGSTLEAALNAVREQSDVIQKQQVAFADAITTAAATLAKWQAIAIDERANQIAGIPVSHLKDKYKRNVYREQAAKELDLQGYVFKTTYDVAGPIEINGERYVKAAYIERLEKEFLAAKGALIWEEIDREQLKEHYKDVDLPWMSAKEKGERIARGAQDALEKIHEGT